MRKNMTHQHAIIMQVKNLFGGFKLDFTVLFANFLTYIFCCTCRLLQLSNLLLTGERRRIPSLEAPRLSCPTRELPVKVTAYWPPQNGLAVALALVPYSPLTQVCAIIPSI